MKKKCGLCDHFRKDRENSGVCAEKNRRMSSNKRCEKFKKKSDQ